MGITGLLPALNVISKKKQLSELTNKRVAVDGYSWLHKGVHACAVELAMGKDTHKYVDYALHRVRLLRYHNIEPYIVLDGGPLPAKQGTESERKNNRKENLARGRALVNQGKHQEARMSFIKAIDVSPEMAYQLIKALKVENVPYVVAPYEADAQLAYLEKQGLVDAILTEDSDLLVFGCRNVWFKMDTPGAFVYCICRDDFGSVTATTSDPGAISLIGWNDAQFRWMAILSGCDYLPSIPGIGLKRANTLLKKWKTAELVVRHLALEGKKPVPPGYLKKFKLAEKCFLHQRVYCPIQERLVHLTEVDDNDWDNELDNYVGPDMDPALAKRIAQGDADPVSLKAMKDINPNYRPGPHRTTRAPIAPVPTSKGKEKARDGGIKDFFGAKPVIPPALNKTTAGKASGKRTLAEITDQETIQKQKKKHRNSTSPTRPAQSKFFSASTTRSVSGLHRRHSDGVTGLLGGDSSMSGPSRIHTVDEGDKENDFDQDEESISEPEDDRTDLSMMVHMDIQQTSRMELVIDDFPDVVEQEDGYISPSPSHCKDVQDLSSPPRASGSLRRHSAQPIQPNIPSGSRSAQHPLDDNFDDVEPVSSPVSTKKRRKTPSRLRNTGETISIEDYIATPVRRRNQGEPRSGKSKVLVEPTPTPAKSKTALDIHSPTLQRGPDLRTMLGVEADESEIGIGGDVMDDQDSSFSRVPDGGPLDFALPPAPSPDTPVDSDPAAPEKKGRMVEVDGFMVEVDIEEEQRLYDEAACLRAVTDGLRKKYGFTPAATPFGPSGSARERAVVLNRNNTSPRRKSTALKRSPNAKKKAEFTPGSSQSRALNLNRNEVNVTPFGRHTVLGGGGGVPTSAPVGKTKKTKTVPLGRQPGTLLMDKFLQPKPSSSQSGACKVPREVVDLTVELDSGDDQPPHTPSHNSRAAGQVNLDRFRYS